MHDFGVKWQLVECVGQHGYQLKSEEGLTPGNDDAGFSQHLFDFCRQGCWCDLFHELPPALSDQPSEAEPEKSRQCSADDTCRGACDLAKNTFEYDKHRQSQTGQERYKAPLRQAGGSLFKPSGRLTVLYDSKLQRGGNQAS